ncbi:MAG: glycosyltransferase family 4 protein [Anaerolineales bacterium]|nr:glycosyltransferase family 4 protein [Anaerolineales bacterium]
MRLLFIADGRSPTALNWIEYFVGNGDEVHLVSLYPSSPNLDLASFHIIPITFSKVVASVAKTNHQQMNGREEDIRYTQRKPSLSILTPKIRTTFRHWFVPRSLREASAKLRELIDTINPDIVHAMRIPYEGMVGSLADPKAPLIISVWGNDFTLHAPSTKRMRALTEQAMKNADALHTDCYKDLRLARLWGYTGKQTMVVPGSGGVRRDVFYPSESRTSVVTKKPVVINPRGLRAYIHNDVFFGAIALVMKEYPQAKVLCPAMKGSPQVQRWLERFGLEGEIDLLPKVSRAQMATLFQSASIVVSPSTHDGTPNSLLEAMACGCFPIAGDIESLREWIVPGVNGLLIDPNDSGDLAKAIIVAIENQNLRESAFQINKQLVREKADYQKVMSKVKQFYKALIKYPEQ